MTATPERVRFPAGGRFHADLKRRVDDYFQRSGLTRFGGNAMRLKTAALISWLVLSWVLLVFTPVTVAQAVLLTISLALAQAGIGFAVMHDANHGSYSPSTRVNQTLSFSLDLIGASSHLWRQKHNILHHTFTNIAGLDADLEPGPFLRFARWQPLRRFHRFQHFYMWLLFGAFPLRWWFLDDAIQMANGRVGTQVFPALRGWALVRTLLGKAAFIAWAFVIPVLMHPTWKIVPFYLLGSMVLGNVLASVFQLAHCLGEADFHDAAPGQLMETHWAEHQVATTVDFARKEKLLSWYLGGLNFQVEHHLFPRVCHVHYPALAVIVEETCAEHHVRYRNEPTLGSALSANVRWLRQLGSGAI